MSFFHMKKPQAFLVRWKAVLNQVLADGIGTCRHHS